MRCRWFIHVCHIVLSLLVMASSRAYGQPTFTITDLGSLGGQETRISSTFGGPFKNPVGQIVGTSQITPNPSGFSPYHAFIWDPVVGIQDLGTLGGQFSSAAAINDGGQVVGESNITGDLASHAFVWIDGVMTDLGTLPGDTNSRAKVIDPDGKIFGESCHTGPFGTDVCHTVMWTPSGGSVVVR